MTIASLGVAASAAGTPLAQTTGSDVMRAQHDAADRRRQIDSDLRASTAAGIAETDGQDFAAGDRDADGRQPWEIRAPHGPDGQPADSDPTTGTDERGGSLDLTI